MEIKEKFILSLDQGTTSSRAILFNRNGQIAGLSKKEFTQIYPRPGWVEHDPQEIWSSQVAVISEVMAKRGLSAENIAAAGITNQRETTIVWNRRTEKPVYNAIVWQDRRTAEMCDRLIADGLEDMIRSKTGLMADAYFSATKVKWILDNVDGARKQAENGDLFFGTVDSWLLWKLTGGKIHATDITNASRTMLFNIHSQKWDDELLHLFGIPGVMLPQVRSCSELFGYTNRQITGEEIPLCGIAGDQQAALFGQLCLDEGMVKNTYGTGCFMIMNSGTHPVESENRLLTTIAWKLKDEVTYGLEGSVFIAGAVIQWLRDGLEIIKNAPSSEKDALSVDDNGGVYFVPALSGLGAPYWDPYARGTITGITRGTRREHIVRAALESIAFQVRDLLTAMERDCLKPVSQLRVDGGASTNNFLMQFQADILGIEVVRPVPMETTALGVAYFAGLASGYWSSIDEIANKWSSDKTFKPDMDDLRVKEHLAGWERALFMARSGR